jgi:hypothetical protein
MSPFPPDTVLTCCWISTECPSRPDANVPDRIASRLLVRGGPSHNDDDESDILCEVVEIVSGPFWFSGIAVRFGKTHLHSLASPVYHSKRCRRIATTTTEVGVTRAPTRGTTPPTRPTPHAPTIHHHILHPTPAPAPAPALAPTGLARGHEVGRASAATVPETAAIVRLSVDETATLTGQTLHKLIRLRWLPLRDPRSEHRRSAKPSTRTRFS